MARILEETEALKSFVKKLVKVASNSTCHRSKCGSLITNPSMGIIVGSGYNSMPCSKIGECRKDNLAPSFKSDKTCCVHAEQRAIMDMFKLGYGTNNKYAKLLFFIRLDENNEPKVSGAPYCSICSKMALDAGINEFVLWHKEGWTAYKTDEYNKLTFEYQ